MNTNKTKVIISMSPEETMKLGEDFAKALKQGDVVAFYGELGSGKTTMIKGICSGLGIEGGVRSPSFVFLRIYKAENTVYHFDFYRLKKKEELLNTGYDEFFYNSGIVLLEWADRIEDLLPELRFDVVMKILNENEREIRISHTGQRVWSM
ncbi:MAG: tRNA (adenosine(37)-N6)-threonylcarbamoyltransferase complex ATPase subunit type 1 TsaE [Candidatus Cloacimonadota bacterium]|nr:MAG: tRNA (adenosine(37)-N6)-threonylcarbamoyltransferase complex ATPase subunit type 1 TsaE [Candidatus Cloacimonadota bacterium]